MTLTTPRIIPALSLAVVLLGGLAAAQTDEEVWPTGINGPKVWPHELSNPWSNEQTNWVYPEGGNPPPLNLLSERIKCKAGTKVTPKSSNSAPWETSRHHPNWYAFDTFSVSRWSTGEVGQNWLAADLGATKTINQVFLTWETAYAKDYDIQLSADSITWKAAKEVRGGNGQADVVNIDPPVQGRYIRMWGVTRGSPYGWSMYDFTICEAGGTSVLPRNTQAAAPRKWNLIMNSTGLPEGVEAFDLMGKARGAGARKVPSANIYVVPPRDHE